MKDRSEKAARLAAEERLPLEMAAAAGGEGELDLLAFGRRAEPGVEPAVEEEDQLLPAAELERRRGLSLRRFHTKPGLDPLDEVRWERREAVIRDEKGEVIFKQANVEVPKTWSQMATNVVVSKYFRGGLDMPERESSVRQLVGRVADTIAAWGRQDGCFDTAEDATIFHAELSYLLINQHVSFNSPVWFNVGVEKKPQCSACFINSVQDSMDSIMDLAKTEGMLFKYGSGTGSNLSTLRSSRERLSSGGWASGPVSFMKGYDAFAGVIKSGGKTRRAAKMVILNADHPDIVDFINCKVNEEKKAWALIEAGYDGSFNGEAYGSVFFQNSNNSVRVTDAFMKAVLDDGLWTTRAVSDGQPVETLRARDMMRQIVEAAHVCGDPGLQFDTTVNDWHTCKKTGPINASNPCSEYMFLDDSACNLASLNLLKFRRPDGEFDITAFRHAVNIVLIAMEIIVDNSSYPRPAIGENSRRFRPLGLGFANLGALLMARGLPYDSDEGRDYAAAITALMTGQAYATSAEMARLLGPFEAYPENRESFLNVIQKHRSHIAGVNPHRVPEELLSAVKEVWTEAYTRGYDYGYRNAQVTVLAPTGTIAFMMDCDTTGIEPEMALVKYKKLVGGGQLKIVNNTVPEALARLGYTEDERRQILAYLEDKETIEGPSGLQAEHLPVFDCAFRPRNGQRTIHYMGHIRMMGACQPFLSGAISKTVNMPNDVSADDVFQAYVEAWKMGLKAIAIYRDGSKRIQPLSTGKDKPELALGPPAPQRVRLPDERQAVTHKFSIAGHEGYITVGLYPNGRPGEMFISMAKEGSIVSGLMDSFATAVSIMLQYGVPMKVLINKFCHVRFEPSGVTSNPAIPLAKSIMDYIFRWLDLKFGDHPEVGGDEASEAADAAVARGFAFADGVEGNGLPSTGTRFTLEETEQLVFQAQADSPPCPECGSVMVRNGSCYKCLNCASTSGCS